MLKFKLGCYRVRGIWRLSLQIEVKVQAKTKLTSQLRHLLPKVPHINVMVARFQFKHHVAPLPLLGCLQCIT